MCTVNLAPNLAIITVLNNSARNRGVHEQFLRLDVWRTKAGLVTAKLLIIVTSRTVDKSDLLS